MDDFSCKQQIEEFENEYQEWLDSLTGLCPECGGRISTITLECGWCGFPIIPPEGYV